MSAKHSLDGESPCRESTGMYYTVPAENINVVGVATCYPLTDALGRKRVSEGKYIVQSYGIEMASDLQAAKVSGLATSKTREKHKKTLGQ